MVLEDLVEQGYEPLYGVIEGEPPLTTRSSRTRSCAHLPFCVCFICELLILNGHAAYILQTLCERRENIKVVHDICSALVCIHAANIVHGDLNGMKYLKSQSTIRACQQALLIGVVYFERTGGCDSKVGADGVGSRHSSPTGLQQTLVACVPYSQQYTGAAKPRAGGYQRQDCGLQRCHSSQ